MRWSVKRRTSDPEAKDRRPQDAAVRETRREDAAPPLAPGGGPTGADGGAQTSAELTERKVAPEPNSPGRRLTLPWGRRDPAAEERRRQEAAVREARHEQAAARRRQVAGQLAAAALSWGMNAWLEGTMWLCLAGGLLVDYIGSYADLAATFGAFGYDPWVRWIMPLGIDLPVTASVVGQLLAGRWKCGWWVRIQLGVLTAALAPLTLIGNALRGAINDGGHFTFHVELWMDLAAFAVPGLGVVLVGWIASTMQGERAELRRRQLDAEAAAMAAGLEAADRDPDRDQVADADAMRLAREQAGQLTQPEAAARAASPEQDHIRAAHESAGELLASKTDAARSAREQTERLLPNGTQPPAAGQRKGAGRPAKNRSVARARAAREQHAQPPDDGQHLVPVVVTGDASAVANGQPVPSVSADASADSPEPPDDRPPAGRRAPRSTSRTHARGHAREHAPRVSATDVRAMVKDAHREWLASGDDQRDDEGIAELLTARGHRISASRVRTYLAELRRSQAAPDSPVPRPHVLTGSAGAPAGSVREA